MVETNSKLLRAWEQVNKENNIWQNLYIKNKAFWFKDEKGDILLSSFRNEDLPSSPYTLTKAGKVLTKLSTFANIMSRRPGTEEVTFYSILNQAHPAWCGDFLDRKMLTIAATPITWRRHQIEKTIRNIVKKHIFQYEETFAFVDIGSGGGFDSLEIERIIQGMKNIVGEDVLPGNYDCLNIDIDTLWLSNNERLSQRISGDQSRIRRENASIFDYLIKKSYVDEFSLYNNLILSCNGFAEFLSDEDLETLYHGIHAMTSSFSGKISVILPFANRNEQQEKTGNKIGFKYRAKEKDFMIQLIEKIFVGFEVSSIEKYSQIVLIVEKGY